MATPRFLFVQTEQENIGVEYLSAALKQNSIEIELLFFDRIYSNNAFHLGKVTPNIDKENLIQKRIIKKIREYQPEVVCFSPFTSQFLWTIKQAKLIKQKFPKVFVLFGGVHVNSVPETVIKQKCIDGIILGEADKPIVEFANNFFDKNKLEKIESLWIKKNGSVIKNKLAKLISDLDNLPFPDKDIIYSQIPADLLDKTYVIMASRGCPFACTYCANNVYQKLYLGQKRLRFRSPVNIVTELFEAKKKYNFKMVEFFDDVLTVDEKRLDELLKLYRKKVKLPFTCYMHPQLMNEQIVKNLKKSGCCWLKMGVQSANEEYRKKYLRRGETNQEIIQAALWCNKHKLTFSLDHIFNLPGETEENLVEAVRLYSKCKPTIINYGTLIYLPGTEIIEQGKKMGILSDKDIEMISEGKDPVVHMSNMELFTRKEKKIKNINISVFAMFMSLIPIAPTWFIMMLLKFKIYQVRSEVPQAIMVILKVLTKIHAKQLYIYVAVFKAIFSFNNNEKRITNY